MPFLKQKYKSFVLLKIGIIPLFIKDCKDLVNKKRLNCVHCQNDIIVFNKKIKNIP